MYPFSVPYQVAVAATFETLWYTPLIVLDHWATTVENMEQAASEALAA
jgi:hypothetical protein